MLFADNSDMYSVPASKPKNIDMQVSLGSKIYIFGLTVNQAINSLKSILIHTRVVSNFETGICILIFDTSTGRALEMQEAKALLISDDWPSFETRFSGYSLPLEINISSTELSSSMYT